MCSDGSHRRACRDAHYQPRFRPGPAAATRTPRATPPIAERTKNLKKIDGFFQLYWDENAGKLFVEIPKLDTEVLTRPGWRPASAPRHRDRSRPDDWLAHHHVRESRTADPHGQPNYQFRALTQNAAEAKTVRDAFARSVLGFPIAAPVRTLPGRLQRVPRPRRQRDRRTLSPR